MNWAEITTKQRLRLRSLFNEMSYVSNKESFDIANEWLQKHNYHIGSFINGEWIFKSDDSKPGVKVSYIPGTICHVQYADTASKEFAVQSSTESYSNWSILSGQARAQCLYNIARNIQKQSALFASLESISTGKPFNKTKEHDVPALIRSFYHNAGSAALMSTEMKSWSPIGVILISVENDCPFIASFWKLSLAVASGNTAILNVGSGNCLSSLLLAELFRTAGFPPGVMNVVIDLGDIKPYFGKIAKCIYSGCLEAGQNIAKHAAILQIDFDHHFESRHTILVLEDADIISSVQSILESLYFHDMKNNGCKVLVQDSIKDTFVEELKLAFKKIAMNHSLGKDADSFVKGRLGTQKELSHLEECINDAIKQGCKIIQFHLRNKESGVYPPTLVTEIQTSSRLFHEEVFGPLIIVVPIRTLKESISVCNQSRFCSCVSVWTEKLTVALEVAHKLKARTVWINCQNENDAAATYDHSCLCGNAYEGGKQEIYNFVKPSWQKSIIKTKFSFPDDYGKRQYTGPETPIMRKTDFIPQVERALMDHTYKLYIGGSQKRPEVSLSQPVYDSENSIFCYVAEGSGKDVCNAVESAQSAYSSWNELGGHNRAQVLYYIAENLDIRKNEFVSDLQRLTLSSHEESMEEVDVSIQRLFYWAAYCDRYGGNIKETQMYGTVLETHESLGVIGIICPDRKPLLSFVSLFAPAIARGNTVVIIPDELCPVPALKMYQIFDGSDVPDGVINVVSGNRDILTRHLCINMSLEALWFHANCEKGECFTRNSAVVSFKKLWVSRERDWIDPEQGQGLEFLFHSTRNKFIWLPMGDIFAN